MNVENMIADLENERERIDAAISALRGIHSTPTNERNTRAINRGTSKVVTRKRKPMSKATKKHLSEMAKSRWADRRKADSKKTTSKKAAAAAA